MAKRRNVKLNIGRSMLRSRQDPGYPSDASYTRNMIQQSKELTDTLLGIINALEDVSEDIIIEVLEPTFEKAKVYCPKDTGALVNSAYLEKASFRGKPRVEMGFARGGYPHYAAIVHENLSMRHMDPTRAKFLEQALKEDIGTFETALAMKYKEFLGI